MTKIGPTPFTYENSENENKNTDSDNVKYENLVTIVEKDRTPDPSFVSDIAERINIIKKEGGVNIIYYFIIV